MKVIWTPTAIKTVKELLEYRRAFYGPTHIKRTKGMIASAGRYLSDNPHLGQIEPLLEHVEGNYRRFMIERNLKLIYKIQDNNVYIMFLWNTYKNPDGMLNLLR
ncbi:MAG: type II toxin-antitoxin system RelE/ParE family toxin [Prevotella sp.]|nr:type II toxin-antitoxin system RelE/ParE family toxin [Candidatus Prevotella equi]